MVALLEYDENKEKGFIKSFINELNAVIGEFNEAYEEYNNPNPDMMVQEADYIHYIKEHIILIRDRSSVFKENYIYNTISENLKKTLNNQLKNILEEVNSVEKEFN